MLRTTIILYLLVMAMIGVGFYLYKTSQVSLLQQVIQPSPSVSESPSPQSSIQLPIQESVINDLTKRLATEPNKISISSMEAMKWSDGSLGCPVAGRIYTQATTSGYEIILQSSGKNYVYHAVNNNHFVYCDPEESDKCTEDSQCGVNICECKAMFNPYISPQDKVCIRVCEGTPKCISNKCQLSK